MKNKQLPVLLAVLAVTGGAAAWKYYHRASAIGKVPAEVGTGVLKNFRPAEITAITLKDSKAKVLIEQKDGKWIIPARDGFPASQDTLTTLVKEAFEMKISDSQRAGASQLGTIKLKTPGDGAPEAETGTLVTFRDSGGKNIASLIAGKVMTADGNAPASFSMSPQGPKTQYLKIEGMGDTVIKARDGFTSLDTDVKNWLDKTQFIKVSNIKSVTVTGPTPEESWKIERATANGELKLDAPAAGEDFDASKAAGVGSAFSFVQFVDVVPAADAAKAALDKPVRTAVITTFDGYTFTVKVGAAEGDNHYFAYTVDAKFDETPPAPAPREASPPPKNDEEKKKADEEKLKADEEKKKTDEEFATALAEKKKKLAEEQAVQNRIFLVAKSSLEPILKKRADYLKDKPAAPAAPAAGTSATTPPVEVKSFITPAPAAGTSPVIEAVTPPITIEPPAAKEAPKTEAPAPAPTPPAPKTEAPAPAAPTPPVPAPVPPAPEAPKAEAPAPAPVPTPEAPKTEAPAPVPAPEAPKTEAPAPPPPAAPAPVPAPAPEAPKTVETK
ncbi:MAG: DUF4340 domain-containing protein [Verrucomicrobiota bacterium]